MSATEQRAALQSGQFDSHELRNEGIDRCERLNPQLGFMVAETYDRSPGGVPILLKDAGQELAGTTHWAGVAALRDADSRSTGTTALAERLEHAGFSIIGKSACPPLANSVTTEPPGFPPTRNPWDLNASVGGSSGGAAAAVACGAVPIAHGSDATGSLRFPAALCGLVTLAPTAGRIDSVAPCGQPPNQAWRDFVLARDAHDLEMMLDVLSPQGVIEPASFPSRVGVLDHEPELGLAVDNECKHAVRLVAEVLEQLGCVIENDWPSALNTVWQRAGASLSIAADATRPHVIRWVSNRLGRPAESNDLPAIVFDAAERDAERTDAQRRSAHATIDQTVRPIVSWWNDHDLLITPATFKAGWPLGIDPRLPECGTLAAPFSLTGQPSLIVPVPRPDRAPLGVQIVGRHGTDEALLSLGVELQQHLDWLTHFPPVFSN